MMRFQTTIASLLAAALVPATFVGQESIDSLEKALSQTVRALEVLGGVQESVESNDPATIGYIRAVTEDPILDDRLRDERLVDLRNQVNLLRTELDILEAPAFVIEAQDPALANAPEGGDNLPAITKGLSSEALSNLVEPKTQGADTNTEADASVAGDLLPRGGDTSGYSADPVAHARACYYARRYEQCISLVAELTEESEAFFWKARALEKLDRLNEAVVAMKTSVKLAGDTPEGRRAQAELEFMEWRLSFLKDAPHIKKQGGSK